MSVYDQLLDIARHQLEAAARGDFNQAVGLFEARERLLEDAQPPQGQERDLVEQVLRIDEELSTAFRERMSSIREELAGAQRARTALQGYRPRLRHTAMALDAAR